VSKFNPTGTLNVSWDANDIGDGDFVRCKNMRIDQQGRAKTRDGCTKLNSSAIDTDIWHIEVQAGVRYVFAGSNIYEDETSILSGLTSAQWSGIQYSAFNDPTKNIFALNGTDRKRIEGSTVYEWGIEAPANAPTLGVGTGIGLTGEFNARYTYVRKVGGLIVSESDPSPAANEVITLADRSLSVVVEQSSDPQVTHLRLYRTLAGGSEYFLDQEVVTANTFAYGYAHDWELDGAYISGTGYKFTTTDTPHSTENTQTWEALFETSDVESTESYGTNVSSFVDLRGEPHAGLDTSRYHLP